MDIGFKPKHETHVHPFLGWTAVLIMGALASLPLAFIANMVPRTVNPTNGVYGTLCPNGCDVKPSTMPHPPTAPLSAEFRSATTTPGV